MMVGKRSFPLGMVIFRGELLNFTGQAIEPFLKILSGKGLQGLRTRSTSSTGSFDWWTGFVVFHG